MSPGASRVIGFRAGAPRKEMIGTQGKRRGQKFISTPPPPVGAGHRPLWAYLGHHCWTDTKNQEWGTQGVGRGREQAAGCERSLQRPKGDQVTESRGFLRAGSEGGGRIGSTLGRTVDFELHAQYLWKRHTS